MTRSDNTLYVAGWNMPGCLPEMAPTVFEDEASAVSYLSWEIGVFWDEDYLAGDEPRDAHVRWANLLSSLPCETAPFSIQNGDGSLTFWVTIVPRSDIPTFDSEGN